MNSTLRKAFNELDFVQVESLSGIVKKVDTIENQLNISKQADREITGLYFKLKSALIPVQEYAEVVEDTRFKEIVDETVKRLHKINGVIMGEKQARRVHKLIPLREMSYARV